MPTRPQGATGWQNFQKLWQANKLDHSALHGNAPSEVEGDKDLRFQLRYENAGKMLDNVAQAQERKRKLEATGAFRTLVQPTAFKRRAGVPNWSSEVHTTTNVTPGQVTDSQGNSFDTRTVLPVSALSSAVKTQAQGGSAPRDTQRLEATRRFLPDLIQIVMRMGSDGATISNAGRLMAGKEGFSKTLREQRMSFRQFVNTHASSFRVVNQGNASKIFIAQAAAARTKAKPDGTLVQFQRLRPITA